MKKTAIILSILSVLIFSRNSSAQTRGVGAGIIVGGPTGISAKFWISNINALDIAIGWSNGTRWERFDKNVYYYDSQSYLHINADYVWHNFDFIRTTQRLPLYYGVGLDYESGYALPTAVGVRGVIGIDWMPYNVPLDVFLEMAPVLYVAPATAMGVDASLGARFFFH
ncbi:MAG: hypothetical protein M1469_11160 [Bacteroidetes bacterium]|nr:hypothetical protein [Bacteroidota bacterium]